MTVGGDLTHARAKEPLPMLGYGPRFCGTFHGMSMHQEWFRFDAYPLLPAFVLFRFEVRETVCNSWLWSTVNEEDQQRFMSIWETQSVQYIWKPPEAHPVAQGLPSRHK